MKQGNELPVMTNAAAYKACPEPARIPEFESRFTAIFWQYLLDRLSLINTIPPLPSLIRNAATSYALP